MRAFFACAALLALVAIVRAVAPFASAADDAAAQAKDPPDERVATHRTATAGRTLFGEVIDDDGAPVAGVLVALGPVSTETGVEGQFTLDILNDAELSFAAPGFVEARVPAAALPTTREAYWSERLKPDSSVRVVTVTSAGAAVAGASSFILGADPAQSALADGPLSDKHGRLILDPAAGDVVVAHVAHGAARVGAQARLDLPPSRPFDVIVVDAGDGRALEGALCLVRPAIYGDDVIAHALRRAWRKAAPIPTDAAGVSAWKAMAGDAFVDVTMPGYRPVRAREVKVSDTRTGVRVELEASPVVRGVVRDIAGVAIAGARVRSDVAGRAGGVTVTDEEGRFMLSEWAARPSSLTVTKRGYRTLTVGGIDGGARRADDLELTMVVGDGDDVTGVGLAIAAQGEAVVVSAVEPGSPAAAAAVLPGDAIVAVDGERLGKELAAAVGAIRGPEGSRVRLTLARDGATREIELTRARIVVTPTSRRRGPAKEAWQPPP